MMRTSAISAFFSFSLRCSAVMAAVAVPLAGVSQAEEPAVQAKASGEVRRVDAANGKVTIKHGAIPELELGAMTLVYRISPELIVLVKPGDNIRFTATRTDGQYWVIAID
ncbi:MAG: copper-binding protein [Kerstersia gyiorum]|jgi:Cu/Ag efflux protein CusF|uniref:copper-binding protein n=1 Tax=Kerstersia gyiorum TaxID=206506 RepID=UPI0024322043|nr:copper-binding protein [Kerstersia gyiorum]MCH4270536.1 copper-binding protein [Kerstersia gyiorum]